MKKRDPIFKRSPITGVIFEPTLCPECKSELETTLSTKCMPNERKTRFIERCTCPKCHYTKKKYHIKDGYWRVIQERIIQEEKKKCKLLFLTG